MLSFGIFGGELQRSLVGRQRFGAAARTLERMPEEQKSRIAREQFDRS